ncbi:glutathione transferase GstA [Dyella sp. LX-66]|uniref:glutathione transferase GstA n=1 Tax=unclassified Dyella TaxID=2634549 RepID=UPI001BE034A4|nr:MULTISPECIES: glutathione transferase GstA [unclassified Dyella]MBT2119028.1 glutathione transferase GstA [Dyella sp. LX-1]MBT2140364.1 glutathione transferase GstA [Dyella sp. LX-66]
MKLYFTPGTCSLAPHIVLRELGLEAELVRVRLGAPPVIAATQADYRTLNPNGYVPLLELDDGSLLTEGVAILQYLADLHPEAGLLPAATPLQRYESMRWLVYISSELHKMFSPWLFHPEYGEQAAEVARGKIAKRLELVERQLDGRDYLLGQAFTVADAYLFAIVSWAKLCKVPLDAFPHLQAWLERVAARPFVQAALQAERLR